MFGGHLIWLKSQYRRSLVSGNLTVKALQVSDLLRVVWSGGQQVLMWLLSEHAGLMINIPLVQMARLTMCLVMTPGSRRGKTGVQMHVPLQLHRTMVVQQQPLAMMRPQEL